MDHPHKIRIKARMMPARAWKSPFIFPFLYHLSLLTSCFACSSSEILPLCPPPSDLSFTAILVCFPFRLLLTSNVVLVSNRLSSLTIGDSERRSSSAQQKDPSADLPAESAGTFNVYFKILKSLLHAANEVSSSSRSRSCPEMRGGAEGPAGLWLHRLRRED